MSGVDIALQINIRARNFARSLNECGKCPKDIYYGNGGNTKFFTGGTMNIHGAHLSHNMQFAIKIHSVMNSSLGTKFQPVINNINVYGRYPGVGAPGGSGRPIQNTF